MTSGKNVDDRSHQCRSLCHSVCSSLPDLPIIGEKDFESKSNKELSLGADH